MKVFRELIAMTWSLVGAGYVLMTVQGGVFRTGLILTFIGVGVQLLGLALGADDDEQG